MAAVHCASSQLSAAFALVCIWHLCGVHAGDWFGMFGGAPAEGGGAQHATDELTADTLEDYIKANSVTAVLFYAPWCFYSQQVMPAWDLAGQKLKIHDPPVKLAKIDAHRYGSVGDKYGVSAFPTMKLFIDGTVYDYDGNQGRGWQQIVKWVNKHIDRDHVLKNVEDADHYLNDNDLAVIGLFGDDHTASMFVNSSRHFEDISFAESRGMEMSTEISKHLSRHATLVCETINVGQGPNSKTVPLPRKDMSCSDSPRNPQRPEWGDKFHCTVTGTELTVKRTDHDEDGWQQNLQIRCCDTETDEHKMHDIPVPSIVMFMPHDERFAVYHDSLNDMHKLDKWISARRSPMVQPLNQETAEKIMDSGPDKSPLLFLISNNFGDGNAKIGMEQEVALREAAKNVRGRVSIVLSGISSGIEKRLCELVGVDEEQLPVLTIVEPHSGGSGFQSSKKYRLDTKGLTAEKIEKFVSDHEEGKLKPYLRSEPVPTAAEAKLSPVLVLVGQTFADVSQQTDKDVLIDFYAPWCGHCRKFEPAYKELAKKLKHVTSLMITKLDATRNEVEGMYIAGFPTIILFRAGASPKRQVMYQGNRAPEDMIAWLKQHCGNSFDETPPVEAVIEEPESGLLDEAEEADL